MCALAGFYDAKNLIHQDHELLLTKLEQAMIHRGPDGSGQWLSADKTCGFAHRRLSIQDPSPAGNQPFIVGQIAITFNGEIYNHPELKKELESLGYVYRSNSDTETLVHAYTQWGIAFLDKLEGMFAFVLFDGHTDQLFLVRDRVGTKPLYFSQMGGILSFASEIKSLWQLPWMAKEFSHFAAYHYLSYMVTPAPYTIFKGVYKLPVAMYAKIEQGQEIEFVHWYSPLKTISAAERKNYDDENWCIDRLEYLIKASVKRRMLSDVPVGAFLSGGVDSSLIVGLMAQHSSNLKTFTAVTEHEKDVNEERAAARKISQLFGTDHYEVPINQADAFAWYQSSISQLDEPLADPVCLPFYFISKAAREQNVVVVQVGEGADELFFGYPLYADAKKLYDNYWAPLDKITPQLVSRAAYWSAKKIMPRRAMVVEQLSNFSQSRDPLWTGALAFGHEHKKRLGLNLWSKLDDGHNDIVRGIYGGISLEYDSFLFAQYHLDTMKKQMPNADFVQRLLYLECQQRLPELLLMRADKMSMLQGVEGRVPFLDHHILEFAFQVSSNLKFKNGVTKYLLKKVAERTIPASIVYRKKVGFAVPLTSWMSPQQNFKNFGNSANLIPDLVGRNLNDFYQVSQERAGIQNWVLQHIAAFKEVNF